MSQINAQHFFRIVILESAIEAQLVESILDQHQIPYRIRSYYDTAYDGLFQVQKGWGELCAPLSYKHEILEILQNIRSNLQDD